MKRCIVVLALAVVASGCGQASRTLAGIKGVSRECVDGVMYLQFASGATVAYNPDGSIRTCK